MMTILLPLTTQANNNNINISSKHHLPPQQRQLHEQRMKKQRQSSGLMQPSERAKSAKSRPRTAGGTSVYNAGLHGKCFEFEFLLVAVVVLGVWWQRWYDFRVVCVCVCLFTVMDV